MPKIVQDQVLVDSVRLDNINITQTSPGVFKAAITYSRLKPDGTTWDTRTTGDKTVPAGIAANILTLWNNLVAQATADEGL